MTTAEYYFLVVAQEKSIARAAEKLVVTPQNLSNHIRRLENIYGELFKRKPVFMLTDAGEVLVKTLQRINIMESNLKTEMKKIQQEKEKIIRFGIHATRARALLPYVLKEFWSSYPYVRLDFHYDNNDVNEQSALRGELDAFMGVNSKSSSDFTRIYVCTENIRLFATDTLLNELDIHPADGIMPLIDIPKIPLLINPSASRMFKNVDSFFASNGITMNTKLIISDFDLQLILASQSQGACFCPSMFHYRIDELNSVYHAGLRPYRLPTLKGNDLSIDVPALKYRSEALNALIGCFRDAILNLTNRASK